MIEDSIPLTTKRFQMPSPGNAEATKQPTEKVDHPAHYGGKDNAYEHIKVSDAWGLNYRLGNATKYICRAGKKSDNAIEDLKKARWYIDSEIQRLEAEAATDTTPGAGTLHPG